jgi:thiosulfate/3-mercaptopyruvate sulfurtransferase
MGLKAGVTACQVSLLLICASTFLLASEDAPSGAMPPVVTTAWLAEHLDDPDLVVVHIGRAGSFEKGHLPDARRGSLRALIRETETGIRDEMPPAGDIADALSELGIASDSNVVAYFADEAGAWAAARFVVTLEHAGFGGRVAYLDGGLPQWRAEKRSVSTEDTAVEKTDLVVALEADVIVDTAWLSTRLDRPEVAIIDGRPQEGYSGLSGHWSRLGHVPGAVNIPFFTLLQEDPPYLLKSRGEITAKLIEAGAQPGDTVVAYCGTGLWASLPYLAARYAGYETRLYDGSFQEWAAAEDLPIETSTASEAAGK